MRKINAFLISFICLFVSGCGKYNEKDLIKDFSKQLKSINSYKINGLLQIYNNEDTFTYDVNVSYKKDDNYKVSLKNQINDYEQVIYRNDTGIYVVTPSLNKSFKFQSEWPYNSSQAYLLQTLLNDINEDNDRTFEIKEDGYVVNTKVNYLSNPNLISQKIYFNESKDVYKVEVYDDNSNIKMIMTINDIKYNESFNDNEFKITNNNNIENQSGSLEEKIYPMYLPLNTYLSDETKLLKENGERIITTFLGDKPFMLIQETTDITQDMNTLSYNGEPCFLSSGIGIQTDNSLEWINNGITYYITSNSLNNDEILKVAESLNIMPVGK